MTQLGESISAPEFLSDEEHNEKTCPWHDEAHSGNAEPMEAPNPDTDTDAAVMSKNFGGTLCTNMEANGDDKPTGSITLEYITGDELQ